MHAISSWRLVRATGLRPRNELKKQFRKIFEPVLPSEVVLERLDIELKMQTTWWSACDELLALYEAEEVADCSAEVLDDGTAS